MPTTGCTNLPDGQVEGSQRRALVTGVGRQAGIGWAVARRLRADGWIVITTGFRGYDDRMAWGADPKALADFEVDFADPSSPTNLFGLLADDGVVSALVMCHCESVDSSISTTTVESFDRHMAVNARSVWLLIREFAAQLGHRSAGGRIVGITSDHTAFNVPYGASKGALDRIVIAAAAELADQHVTANVINPGATDNGWMTDVIRESVLTANLSARISTPEDTANLVSFLLSTDGVWINGQLLYSNGGLRP